MVLFVQVSFERSFEGKKRTKMVVEHPASVLTLCVLRRGPVLENVCVIGLTCLQNSLEGAASAAQTL